jgi:hypothetical protein
MSRRALSAAALVVLALGLGACLGGDDEGATTSPTPAETRNREAAPPSPSGLPPQLVECFKDRGFDLESPAEIHSAPPQVVQECFGALHQGGGQP